jgi:hypothetical protein
MAGENGGDAAILAVGFEIWKLYVRKCNHINWISERDEI